MSLPQSFLAKKKRILEQLTVPYEQYDDLSPKGSIDEGIRDLIGEINEVEGLVTTSSCAGRISVFLEGTRSSLGDVKGKDGDETSEADFGEKEQEIVGDRVRESRAGIGGKGGGGRWLFVSHDPIDIEEHAPDLAGFLGMKRKSLHAEVQRSAREVRFIHFKFEPMILHVLAASLHHAQNVLSAALQAGFRESGALNLTSSAEQPMPMVGIRTMGLALESLVGYEEDRNEICTVPEWQLRTLLEISNERFVENTKRVERFRELLQTSSTMISDVKRGKDGKVWEDPQVRRERKRAEGLKISQESKVLRNGATP